MYLFYENHIKEFLQVEEMWEANKDNLMNGLTSSSTVTNKVSGTPQDGESYVDSYPDTESKQVSEMNQSDKSVFKKLQELTKQLTNYKKT